jgi:hypothetical protein
MFPRNWWVHHSNDDRRMQLAKNVIRHDGRLEEAQHEMSEGVCRIARCVYGAGRRLPHGTLDFPRHRLQ